VSAAAVRPTVAAMSNGNHIASNTIGLQQRNARTTAPTALATIQAMSA
jgi:hypothetical protein